mmetsp:Transcript_17501/g.35832  ORF Transcript_17501/g.35832 Transcript_17501/m.35832 type:complete len:183 (+) Transcript_17501:43-591(+)|eukprot:CAMPEP_0202832174 /NCGR_PEP_ID=MMETSP1389-20130828/17255_1 /ASSEMBLY_ACC=CAM_ASM_000865 /TAXON_ID=302021 /ORGANISM="Rhodomonas sp., Strain CCMP768" /LENGTH=182 /DNA_ID=CAMNT_0049505961 /DNA_START=40 /DNA_END=588 /DNA_ORIENTATION=-
MPSVFVRTLSGSTLTVSQEGSVKELKEDIEQREGIACDEQKLVVCGHLLEDSEMLEELPAESTLHLSLGLLGGGKKRKKKTYTKPKKIKHKHKKVKLAVLKYYKVDQQSGKITRLRKECPKECGAGIFMANHFNRSYCGKCHTTYMLDKPGRDPALDKKKDAPAAAAAAAPAAPAKGGKKKK